jgi:hypothetical protein
MLKQPVKLICPEYQTAYYPLKWSKDSCWYNAPIQSSFDDLRNPQNCFHVNIEKLNNDKYQVFTMEHEPEEIEKQHGKSIFNTLREAKEFLQQWAIQYTWLENQIAKDPMCA